MTSFASHPRKPELEAYLIEPKASSEGAVAGCKGMPWFANLQMAGPREQPP